jgi:tetratricopeptide (TPR) repeat protein
MKKILILYCSFSLLETIGFGQSIGVDRNKLIDFFQNQDFEGSINYLESFEVIDSSNIQTLGYLAYAHYMKEDLMGADRYFQSVLRIDSNNIGAMQYLVALHRKDDPDFAESLTRKLIFLQPGKSTNYRNLGEFLARRKEKDSALNYLNYAYNMSPRDVKNGAALAEFLLQEKGFPRADSILDAGLERDSLIISYIKLRIRSAYESKNYQLGVVPGERLLRSQDNSQASLTELIICYYNLKMYPDCIRVSEYMMENDIATESVYYYEAKAFAKLKDFSKSNDLLQVCLSIALSKSAELYYYNLGDNYESLKQYKKAIANYDSAYIIFGNPLMKYYSGRSAETGLKNQKLAQKYYGEYLRKARPESVEEKKAYDYVKSKWSKKK